MQKYETDANALLKAAETNRAEGMQPSEPYRVELINMLENHLPAYDDEAVAKKRIITFLKETQQPFGKTNLAGHITASAWLINSAGTEVLLTHHYKLNRWLQLGGHTEIGETIIEAARREALEESGLTDIQLVSDAIFDLDVHEIPTYRMTPSHIHYDIRFMFMADSKAKTTVNRESKQLKWIPIDQVAIYTREWSVLRMVQKTPGFLKNK
ncbi:NUDIX hydrolase [Fusibacter paucivorans]|uniref:NUDIX hydrolase n=1 Tax=Fusibacter paucivorans TaxID=76009 RepID=A0ABS5PMS0_9FIRM|nr:NUDIX hydrolase [Fusibacter paucivorans]MBS7526480.1 NUDIX hydrolase [Fusibacter paucivorans]